MDDDGIHLGPKINKEFPPNRDILLLCNLKRLDMVIDETTGPHRNLFPGPEAPGIKISSA